MIPCPEEKRGGDCWGAEELRSPPGVRPHPHARAGRRGNGSAPSRRPETGVREAVAPERPHEFCGTAPCEGNLPNDPQEGSLKDLDPGRESRLRRMDQGGWSLVADRVIHGLCHELNGRASSLGGLLHLLSEREEGDAAVRSLVEGELDELEKAVRLLRLLPDDADGREILAPGEFLPELMALLGLQRGLEEVSCTLDSMAGAPAVQGDRTIILRSLALFLTRAMERASVTGAREVRMRGWGEGGGLVLEMEFPEDPGKERKKKLALPALKAEMEEMVKGVLEEEGIEVETNSGSVRLRYPSPFSS